MKPDNKKTRALTGLFILTIFVFGFLSGSCYLGPMPKDIDEAVKLLKLNVPTEEQNAFAAKDEETAVEEADLNRGAWIRNNWIRPEGAPLGREMERMKLRHPDDMCNIILKSFWRSLNNKPLDIEGQLTAYREHWKYMTVPDGVVSPVDGAKIEFLIDVPCEKGKYEERCREMLGMSVSDGSVWAYQWGKGLSRPTKAQEQKMKKTYMHAAKTGEIVFIDYK